MQLAHQGGIGRLGVERLAVRVELGAGVADGSAALQVGQERLDQGLRVARGQAGLRGPVELARIGFGNRLRDVGRVGRPAAAERVHHGLAGPVAGGDLAVALLVGALLRLHEAGAEHAGKGLLVAFHGLHGGSEIGLLLTLELLQLGPLAEVGPVVPLQLVGQGRVAADDVRGGGALAVGQVAVELRFLAEVADGAAVGFLGVLLVVVVGGDGIEAVLQRLAGDHVARVGGLHRAGERRVAADDRLLVGDRCLPEIALHGRVGGQLGDVLGDRLVGVVALAQRAAGLELLLLGLQLHQHCGLLRPGVVLRVAEHVRVQAGGVDVRDGAAGGGVADGGGELAACGRRLLLHPVDDVVLVEQAVRVVGGEVGAGHAALVERLEHAGLREGAGGAGERRGQARIVLRDRLQSGLGDVAADLAVLVGRGALQDRHVGLQQRGLAHQLHRLRVGAGIALLVGLDGVVGPIELLRHLGHEGVDVVVRNLAVRLAAMRRGVQRRLYRRVGVEIGLGGGLLARVARFQHLRRGHGTVERCLRRRLLRLRQALHQRRPLGERVGRREGRVVDVRDRGVALRTGTGSARPGCGRRNRGTGGRTARTRLLSGAG